ncbi:S8 family serine peptidase [Planococcus citreus]|uniref:Subtilisin family serine protease n=1 Tax=Planococcus citreus TaxID=1373 RepID=A0A497YHU5_9BACL|nr:S8 family serine peptidase [Planococcus citreus]RLJ90528.1 subtilisin family serine protease [Planococcus citreus]
MKQTTTVLAAMTLALSLIGIGTMAQAQGPTENPADRVIVKLREQAAMEGAAAAQKVATAKTGDGQIVTLEVPQGQSVESFMAELSKQGHIEYVEPDHRVELAAIPGDPFYAGYQYHHRLIGSESAWDKTTGKADVLVAIIDDGFDLLHPDLKGRIVSPFNIITGKPGSVSVEIHGTHVAGLIAGNMDNELFGVGVAPSTSIMPIDVFDGEDGFISDVAAGVYHAVDNGADIINMSLVAYSDTNVLREAVQYAHSKNVLVVAAAGNDGISSPYYPAAYQEVLSVASTDAADKRSDFSNFGKTIDIAAPGTGVFSIFPDQSFGGMDGTSMSTPIVSGAAALLKANEPKLSNTDIAGRLMLTAKDLGTAGKDVYYGHGRLNVDRALTLDASHWSDRLAGSSRYDTAVAISKAGWSSASTVIIATGTDFPDALAGGPLAYKENAPILLTKGDALHPAAAAEIRRLKPGKAILLGSNGALSATVEQQVGQLVNSVERIGGKTRYETAALIAKKITSDRAVVSNGQNFPDVLSVSPYAAKNGIPILLTRTGTLPAETKAALAGKDSTIVTGGTSAVSNAVMAQLPGAKRYGGTSRYDTGKLINQGLPMGKQKAFIATGTNFPDALAGSVLAAKKDAPILLTAANSIPSPTKSLLPSYPAYSIFGSKGAITPDVKFEVDLQLK